MGGFENSSVLGFSNSQSKKRFKPTTSCILEQAPPPNSTADMEQEEEEEGICWCYLPDELVTEILEWLPVKSVLNFRLVSKSWSALFKTQIFITNHHLKQKRSKSGTMLLLRRRHVPPHTHHDVLSFHNLDSPEQEVRPEIPISSHLNDLAGHYETKLFTILGPVNGIICIFTAMRFMLCNPALHEFKPLPPISFDDIFPDGYDMYFWAFGFGVSSSEDFKVVVFHRSRNRRDKTFLPYIVAHLYNSRTDSWSRFHNSTLFPHSSFNSDCFLNGAWHWPGTTVSSDDNVIVSLDVTSEVFRKLELPHCLRGSNISVPRLSIINNCLGVVHYKKGSTEPGEVWVMKKYGVKESWSKLFTPSPQPYASILLPWKNDTMFMLQRRGYRGVSGGVVAYDSEANDVLKSINLRTSEVKIFEVFGAQQTIHGLIYEESLVLQKHSAD